MYYVRLHDGRVFVFYSQNEADEFASCISAEGKHAVVEVGELLTATDHFEDWSF